MSENKGNGTLPAWIAAGAAIVAAAFTIGWQGVQEHDQWERDARQAAYSEFYKAAQLEQEKALKCAEQNEAPDIGENKVSEALFGVELFASEATMISANVVADSVQSYRRTCTEEGQEMAMKGAAMKAISEQLKPNSDPMRNLLNSMRTDLQVGN